MTTVSHNPVRKPTALLALIALGIVYRFRPAWLGVDLKTAAAEHGIRADRLSRLVSGAIASFEAVVAKLTRRGRPAHEPEEDRTRAELALLREVLGVARALLAQVRLRRSAARELLVGALSRLEQSHGITRRHFCSLLGLPERTLRQWCSRARRVAKTPSAKPQSTPAPPRPKRRGRFGFDVLLPGTQFGADTTDLVAFDVELKLVAAQDIGGRDESLFDAIVVDDHESGDIVATVFGEVLQGKAGAQAITDQGTPYLASVARGALEALQVEHAPQREGDPLGKATVERAFRTVKRVAGPMLEVTNRIARAVPELCCPTFAKATVMLLLSALLRAYQHGARAGRAAAEARGGIDPDELTRRAEQSRDRSRATDRSARLLLAHIHELYAISGSLQSFVNSLRRYPVEVLRDAEREFAAQCHRDDIRNRKTYFAAIVRRLHDEHQRRQRIAHLNAEASAIIDAHAAQHRAERRALRADPVAWLRQALELIAMQWRPDVRALLCSGAGIGLGHLHASVARLAELHGAATTDVARGVLNDFRLAHVDRIGNDGVAAVAALLQRALAKLPATVDCAAHSASAIFTSTGRSPRPPPPNRLRI